MHLHIHDCVAESKLHLEQKKIEKQFKYEQQIFFCLC